MIVAIVGDRRQNENLVSYIVTIAEQFTSDPSDRERSPTIIWKPGFTVFVDRFMLCNCLFSLATVKTGPASYGELHVFGFYVTFHVFSVIVLVMYLTVTSTNFTAITTVREPLCIYS